MRWHPRDEMKWKKHFAWVPVQCRCGSVVWLETVWRRREHPVSYDASLLGYEYAVFEERPDITEEEKDDLT